MQGYGEINPAEYRASRDRDYGLERFRLGVRVTSSERKDFGAAGAVYFVRLVVLDTPDINTPDTEFVPGTEIGTEEDPLVANPRSIKMEPNVGDELEIVLTRRKNDYACIVSSAAPLVEGSE